MMGLEVWLKIRFGNIIDLINTFCNCRHEYSTQSLHQHVRKTDHELSFRVVTPKPDENHQKLNEMNIRQPRFELNDLVASELSSHNSNSNLLSSEANSYFGKKYLHQEYSYDYPSHSTYQDNNYNYSDQELPDHIVIWINQ